jgi:hypothetical protein
MSLKLSRLVGLRILVIFSSVVMLVVLTRNLSTSTLGVYFFLASIFAIFSAFEVGIGSFLLTKSSVVEVDMVPSFFSASCRKLFRTTMHFTLLCLMILAVSTFLVPAKPSNFLIFMLINHFILLSMTIAIAPIRIVLSLLHRVLWGVGKGHVSLMLNFGVNVVSISLVLLDNCFGLISDEALVFCILLIPIVLDCLVIRKMKILLHKSNRHLDFESGTNDEFTKHAQSISGSRTVAFLGVALSKLDIVLLSIFCSPAEIALLGLISRIFLSVINLFDVLAKQWWVTFAKLIDTRSKESIYKTMRFSNIVIVFSVLFLILPISLATPKLIQLMSPELSVGVPQGLVYLFAIYAAISLFSGPIAMFISAALLSHRIVKIQAVSALVSILLTLSLGPSIGPIASPVGSCIGLLASSLGQWRIVKKFIGEMND